MNHNYRMFKSMKKSAPSRKNKRFPQEKELPSGGTQNGVSPSLY